MTVAELQEFLTYHAERLDQLHTVLSVDAPKDADGFVVKDGSDLSDALHGLTDTATALSRMAFSLAKFGIDR